jgi:hypothetical protein
MRREAEGSPHPAFGHPLPAGEGGVRALPSAQRDEDGPRPALPDNAPTPKDLGMSSWPSSL